MQYDDTGVYLTRKPDVEFEKTLRRLRPWMHHAGRWSLGCTQINRTSVQKAANYVPVKDASFNVSLLKKIRDEKRGALGSVSHFRPASDGTEELQKTVTGFSLYDRCRMRQGNGIHASIDGEI